MSCFNIRSCNTFNVSIFSIWFKQLMNIYSSLIVFNLVTYSGKCNKISTKIKKQPDYNLLYSLLNS
uniref:Putative ovule protein n=1 Tax=Solanum chacoense TaxID=4108 RepID=A0A0V0GK36_SOLCH